MPVELRKRKAPQPVPDPAPPAKKTGKVGRPAKAKKPEPAAAKKEDDKKDVVASAPALAPAATASKKVAVGDVIDVDEFGGEIQTNDGETTTLKKLLEESGSGVVLFTYPKASTPGCKSVSFFLFFWLWFQSWKQSRWLWS